MATLKNVIIELYLFILQKCIKKEVIKIINLNQLRAFYYVAKYLSFTVAAQKLFISQPAVTAQIKLFENYYDLKFFKRIKNKLYLTTEGRKLF